MLSRLGRCMHTSSQRLAAVAVPNASQKIYRARVNSLLFGADRLLLTPRADTLASYLMAKLSDEKFHNTYRAVAFMRLMRFSLERHLFGVALTLYDRMLSEGFLAVYPLALRLSALKIVQQATANFEGIVPQLTHLFKERAYDVPAFMDLLSYLTDHRHAPGALVDDLAHAFVSVRQIKLSEYPDLVGELASINMRADRLDAAQKWLQVFEDTCGAQGILPDVAPYSDIIGTLNDIHPSDGDAIQDVLVRMRSAGVSPDTNVFNALIRVNLIQHRYKEAFSLYHVFMEKRSNELMPNDVTYKMLFRAAHFLGVPRIARRRGRPENAIPPRRLFRDMLVCHLERTNGQPLERSTIVSVSAFHLVLRTFMAREDYAAAYVVICALHAFGFRPNLQTYLIVFVNLLRRMKHEASIVPSDDSYRLVDFFTHLRPDEVPDLDTLLDRIRRQQRRPAFDQGTSIDVTPAKIGVETASHLLDLGESSRQTDDDLVDISVLPRFTTKTETSSLSRGRRRVQHRMPSVEMLMGADKQPSSSSSPHFSSSSPSSYELDCAFFSPVPLARIVQKALLGELFRKAVHRGAEWDWKGAVQPIIEETGREMIPKTGAGGDGGDLASGLRSGAGWETLGKRAEMREGRGVLPFAAARMRRRVRRGARGGREIAFDFEES